MVSPYGPEMSTPLNRPSILFFGTQDCSNAAALLLILELGKRDLQQGSYRDIEELLHEVDLEQSDGHARTLGER
jgi:hypothetical protein